VNIIIFGSDYLVFVIILLFIFAFLFFDKKAKFDLIKLGIITLPLAYLLGHLGSLLINNPRPFIQENIKPLAKAVYDNGFPSDHTLFVMTIAFLIFAIKPKIGMPFIILGLFVGIFRIFAKLHYPIDIIGSILIAGITSLICFYFLKYYKVIKG